MELLEQEAVAPESLLEVGTPGVVEFDELSARRSLRKQIARLERELSDALLTTFDMGGVGFAGGAPQRIARVLDLGELERLRDELAERLHAARLTISRQADFQEASRLRLEQMLLEPAKHRFARVACRDLGEGGCGVWQVRPRLGLIGMLMGWWEVKLSSGCPLARGRGSRRGPQPRS
jgi:hypothetical protein